MGPLAKMDLMAMSASLVALLMGAVIGWLIARWRLATRIAALNTNLVLERRLNKQLCETIQVAAAPAFVQAPELTSAAAPPRESTVMLS
jgi:ribose/xylose/arabinose/galactoside ABC-type transport system permease subunit